MAEALEPNGRLTSSRPAPAVRGEPRRILVKQANWLGDVVMSLPALKAVRQAYPDSHLALLIKWELASLFDGSGWVDEVIPYRVGRGAAGLTDRWRIVEAIRRRRFDLAILFPNSFEAALWVALARVPRRVGFACDGRGLLLTDRLRPTAPMMEAHQVHYLLHMLKQTLGLDGAAQGCTLEAHEPHRAKMRAWLDRVRRRPDAKLAAIAPAAAYGPAKEWPAGHFAALVDLLADRFGAECILVGAPNERARCEQVAAACRNRPAVAAGETSVGELVALLSLSDAFVGNDSGCMHVAGAVGIPTVGIYGSTRPGRTGPLGPRTTTLYRQIECSPCLERTCRFGHYNCLQLLGPQQAADALVAMGALT